MAAITRLGPHGHGTRLPGSFAGREEVVPVAQLQMLQATITVVPDIVMAASVSEELLAKVESIPTIAVGKIKV